MDNSDIFSNNRVSAARHHHPAAGRRSTGGSTVGRTPSPVTHGTSALNFTMTPRDVDAEVRLMGAIARRQPLNATAITRTMTVRLVGLLSDGQLFWRGSEGTWGVIDPVLAELLGWNVDIARSTRAEVHTANHLHTIVAVRQLVAVPAL